MFALSISNGVDACTDMLTQARIALKGRSRMQLEQVEVGAGETAKSPYVWGFFDLITFTNALHDIPDPVGTLAGLRRLLAQEGQLVVEDFARREQLFVWAVIEWLGQQIEGTYVRAYTLAEAQSLC